MAIVPTNAELHARPVMHWAASSDELSRLERLVSELSAGFINLAPSRIDAAIVDGLHRIVELLDVERSSLSVITADGEHFQVTHTWSLPDFAAVPFGRAMRLPWLLATLAARQIVVISRLDELPPEASEERELYRKTGMRSHVALPVFVAGQLVATLGFAALREERTWPDALVQRLMLLGEIFGNALARKRAHEEIEQALGFERLLVDISTALLRTDSDPGTTIDAALQRIGEFLAVDRAVLWSAGLQDDRYEPTHLWVADGVVRPPTLLDEVLAPTIFRRIAAGEVVAVSNVDELPAEAGVDRRSFAEFGTLSALAVPLHVGRVVVGALTLSCVRNAREWPPSLIPRVRLIGETFASVLARERYASTVLAAKSETAQYRERLAHLVRVHTVGEMSAAIAHEVNQPLMAIENYAIAVRHRLASAPSADRVRIDELLAKIGFAAARAGDVLKRLRSIVKKHESEATEFDLASLVASTVGLVEIESRLQNIRVELALEPDLPRVLADEVQIQQVVLNLARNGIEAMHETAQEKVLRVEAMRSGERELVVRVVDSGKGINPSDAEHLFEPFYSTKEKGLGIGLAICRSIVEAHGGKLTYSPGRRGGTVFEFTLPAASDLTSP